MDNFLKLTYEQEYERLSDKCKFLRECRFKDLLSNSINGLDEEYMVPVERTFTGTNVDDKVIKIMKKIHEAEKDKQCEVVELSEETKQFIKACLKYLQELSKEV